MIRDPRYWRQQDPAIVEQVHSTVERDQLDELKTNINEQQVVAKAGAFALGRKTDELIIGQLGTLSQFAGSSVDGLTKGKVLTAFEMLGTVDVPDDGQRFAVVAGSERTAGHRRVRQRRLRRRR